jgi:hypothetical protein
MSYLLRSRYQKSLGILIANIVPSSIFLNLLSSLFRRVKISTYVYLIDHLIHLLSQTIMERRDSVTLNKPRRNKPCDLCKQKKLLCDLSGGPPCLRCQKSAQPCVFAQRRAKRARQKSSQCQASMPSDGEDTMNEVRLPPVTEPWHLAHGSSNSVVPTSDARPCSRGIGAHAERLTHSHAQDSTRCSTDNSEPPSSTGSVPLIEHECENEQRHDHVSEAQMPTSVFRRAPRNDNTKCTTLENIPRAFSFFIGPTGVSDVNILLRQLDDAASVSLDLAAGLNIRTVDQVPGHPQKSLSGPVVFGVTDEALVETAEPRASKSDLERIRAEFWSLLNRKSAYHLVSLYAHFVEPCFSILSPDQIPTTIDEIDKLSLALLSAICATSLPFALHEDALYSILPSLPKSERLYRISWSMYCQELHAPNLMTLQTCLVLQHNLPSNPVLSDTAFKWSQMATAVAIAQTIGLHRDPGDWLQVPEREIKLRRKLWWAMWSMEKWYSLARGMPSHLHSDQFDVEPLRPSDISVESNSRDEHHLHFEALVSLTTILSEVQDEFYTVKAVAITSQNLELSLERARPLRVRLQKWRDELPNELRIHRRETLLETDNEELDANASLHLCYITTLMTLFRALLRPLEPKDGTSGRIRTPCDHLSQAVMKGGLNCAQELVNLMDFLSDTQWNAFWHSCKY